MDGFVDIGINVAGEQLALHPAPEDEYAADHRDSPNREQMRIPSEYQSIWRRTVVTLAAELQIEPIDAHFLLADAGRMMTPGIAWEWWLP